jgi:RimJ/RimL family protein N-acetyltransferase
VFHVIRLTDPAIIRAFLTRNGAGDRARYAYMLGDLNRPYWENAAFYGAFDSQSVLQSVLLYYRTITIPPVISAGDPDGILAIWAVIVEDFKPITVVYHAQPEHMTAVQHFFTTPDPMQMWRMAITPNQLNPAIPLSNTRRLTSADTEAMQGLFNSGAPEEFMDGPPHITPELFASAPFLGAFRASELVAVAGTHIVSPQEKLGAVGYVFTHPAARGQGYATQVTAAVTRALFTTGIDLVVLNVKQVNTPAIRAYERIGYNRQSPLMEGVARRLPVE